MHRAGAAEPDAAPILAPGQLQLVAEVPQQRHLWIAIERALHAIDLALDHGLPSLFLPCHTSSGTMMSILPHASHASVLADGIANASVTSRQIVWSRLEDSSLLMVGFPHTFPTTSSLLLRVASVIARPKPREIPVRSQTRPPSQGAFAGLRVVRASCEFLCVFERTML
jgi:hypothetical protein